MHQRIEQQEQLATYVKKREKEATRKTVGGKHLLNFSMPKWRSQERAGSEGGKKEPQERPKNFSGLSPPPPKFTYLSKVRFPFIQCEISIARHHNKNMNNLCVCLTALLFFFLSACWFVCLFTLALHCHSRAHWSLTARRVYREESIAWDFFLCDIIFYDSRGPILVLNASRALLRLVGFFAGAFRAIYPSAQHDLIRYPFTRFPGTCVTGWESSDCSLLEEKSVRKKVVCIRDSVWASDWEPAKDSRLKAAAEPILPRECLREESSDSSEGRLITGWCCW